MLNDLSILFVDADEDTCELAEFLLRELGASVSTAQCASEAMAILNVVKIDIAMIDVVLPGEDGCALLRRMRRAGFGMPAVALTALTGAQHLAEEVAAGFDAHVTKPYNMEDLAVLLHTFGATWRSAEVHHGSEEEMTAAGDQTGGCGLERLH